MNLRKLFILTVVLFLSACSFNRNSGQSNEGKNAPTQTQNPQQNKENPEQNNLLKQSIINKYQNLSPHLWGEALKGVLRHIDTDKKVIALTFDACGGPGGSGYDANIINYLTQKNISATLFINSRWIDANPNIFNQLSKSPLFQIENHGYLHRPLSATGKAAWGIRGTKNVEEMVDEVLINHNKITNLIGQAPKYFRSGTAYYDEIGVKVVKNIGEQPVGYSVLGDAGATYKTEQVKKALLSARSSDIVIMHMNQPTHDTSKGLELAIPEMIKRGYTFVKLSEYPLKE